MALKATILFQLVTGNPGGGVVSDQHIGGWSESLYLDTNDVNAMRDLLYNANAFGPGYCLARAACLPTQGQIVGQRITQVLPRLGRSQTSSLHFPGSSGMNCDVPQMALAITAPAVGTINVRRFNFRGIPDENVINGEYVPFPAFKAAMDILLLQVRAFSFPGQDFTQPQNPFLSINNTGLMDYGAAVPYAVGDKVQIIGAKNFAGNTIKTKTTYVTNILPLTQQIQLQTWTDGAAVGGAIRKVVTILFGMNTANIAVDRVVVRKVGRPFAGYRGRASRRS